MSTMLDPSVLDAAHGKRVEITLALSVPAFGVLLSGEPPTARQLADAALHLAEEEPNKAVALLIGSAVDCATRADDVNIALAVRAAVVLLRSIAHSQLQGVVGQ